MNEVTVHVFKPVLLLSFIFLRAMRCQRDMARRIRGGRRPCGRPGKPDIIPGKQASARSAHHDQGTLVWHYRDVTDLHLSR